MGPRRRTQGTTVNAVIVTARERHTYLASLELMDRYKSWGLTEALDEIDELSRIVNHVLIRGMLELLPEPGAAWSDADRAIWLKALGMNLEFVFPRCEGGSVGQSGVINPRPADASSSETPAARDHHDPPRVDRSNPT